MTDFSFFRDKKVLITGHTGFKGSWLSMILLEAGAKVVGYGLEPSASPSLFGLCGLDREIVSHIADIRNLEELQKVTAQEKPDIVIHMAAQPIVRRGYREPVYTYEVNVMGTVHILECVRKSESVRSFLNVTTDKVYWNREWKRGYREEDELNGLDPYSNSKSCSELVTFAYCNSYWAEQNASGIAVSTARAGNVIGGGDFAEDRILPDCVRAIQEGKSILVRNPNSVRPYQHVLEPLGAYLMILQKQWENPKLQGCYNVGPEEADCCSTARLVSAFCEEWERQTGHPVEWISRQDAGPQEANYLKLDCTKIKSEIGWRPRMCMEETLEYAIEWYAAYLNGKSVEKCTKKQIEEYLRRS